MESTPQSPEYGRVWWSGVWSCNLVFTSQTGFVHRQTWRKVTETKTTESLVFTPYSFVPQYVWQALES